MWESLQNLVSLSGANLLIALVVVFVAGLVRGFSGFGLSALTMAGLTVIIPPIALIPTCYLIEATASLVMLRGGIRNADFRIVLGLAIFSAIGFPLGLSATKFFEPSTSQMTALVLIIILALMQLLKKSPAFLGTRPGLYAAGLTAGVVTGLASLGGMVVALYVLAQKTPIAAIRGSLVMYLFIGMFTSGTSLVLMDVMTKTAFMRGLVFAPVVIIGVLLGSLLFDPSREVLYKRVCLLLLISLATLGMLRLIATAHPN